MKALDVLRSRQPWLITPEALDHFAARTAAFATGQISRDDPPTHPLLNIDERIEPPPTPGLRREGSRGDEKGNS